MIHRIANHCFWLQRYYQRVKESAKLLKVYHKYSLDHDIKSESIQDHPLIIAAGFEPHPVENNLDDYESIAQKLTWDPTYENSIFANLKKARDNAHLLREIICDEAWSTLNDLWLWLNEPMSLDLYHKHRCEFFDLIIEHQQLTQGIFEDTLRQDELYHFMRLGMLIEKISIHTNIVELTLGYVSDTSAKMEIDSDRMLLEGLFGWEPFCRSYAQKLTPHTIVEFLIMDPYFPGSISFCIKELNKSLHFVKFSNKNRLLDIEELLHTLKKELRQKAKPSKITTSLRRLTSVMDKLAGEISTEYFQEKSS